MKLNIWRAPTDNDRKIKLEWMDAHYDQSYVRAYETSYQAEESKVTIFTHIAVVAATVQKVLDIHAVWEVTSEWRCFCKNEYGKRYGIPHAFKIRAAPVLKR